MMGIRHPIPPDTIEAQRRAADPVATAWVSANAGSGKTHVLTQRVIRLLLAGVPPAKILCLTFTKAAAANMSLRVFDTLSKWTSLDDTSLEGEIRATGAAFARDNLAFARRLFARTVETPGGLKIQTIHAFCERLLHLFPFEARVASHFRVIEDDEQAELLKTARDEALAQAAADNGELGEALRLLSSQTNAKDFDELLKAVLSKREHLDLSGRSHEAYKVALRKGLGIETNRSASELEEAIVTEGIPERSWREIAARLEKGSKSDQDKGAKLREALTSAGAARRRAYLKLFLTEKNEPVKKLVTAGLEKSDPALKSTLEAEQDRICRTRELLKSVECLDRSVALVRLASRILQRYTDLKDRRALLDFDDLIAFTRRLLAQSSASWVLYKLDSGIDHILVDEAQDTSPGQWEILSALAAEFMAGEGQRRVRRTFFAVGDEKQSIYSFQGAEPRKFEEMRRHFEKRAQEASLPFERVPLRLSFRSAPGILQCVDSIYADASNRRGLTYGDDVETVHEALKRDLPSVVEIWPRVVGRDTDQERDWRLPLDLKDAHDPPMILADRIARMIASWLEPASRERVVDGNGRARAIRAGDIMILVRRRNSFFEAVIRALKERGVPVAGADRLQLLENIAVMDLLAAARAALLPDDDLSLACVLKSPLIGFSDEDLLAIAPGRPGSLYEALAGSKQPSHLQAYGTIEDWRKRARQTGPFGFFAHLLGAEGGRRKMQLRLGPEARDAMDEFMKLALDHERREVPSLQRFVHDLEDLSIKRDMEAASESVRVLTVHASKGLEAKIVFLPDTCSAPGSRFDPKVFRIDSAAGPLLAWSPKSETDCGPLKELRATAREESAEEYRRLLYVAATRAEERLYVMGFHGVRGPDADCWYTMIENSVQGLEGMEQVPAFWGEGELVWRCMRGTVPEDAEPVPAFSPASLIEPPWIRQVALAEASAPPPVRPSSALAAADQNDLVHSGDVSRASGVQTGRILHELLHHLATVSEKARPDTALAYVCRRGAILPEETRRSIVEQALRIVSDDRLSALFGPGSRAEVAMAGRIDVNGREIPIVGQIDRLVETPFEVVLADFKSGSPPAGEMPASYATQLALYRAAVARLYPDRPVHALLVWTETGRIEELTEDRARRALARLPL